MGDLFSAFKGTEEGQSVLLAQAVSQVTLILNNQYAKVAYFEVACPEPYYLQTQSPRV